MKEEKSVVYTLILGVCMLLCLLLIGKMLLHQPAPQPAEPREEEGDTEVELQLDEDALYTLIGEALPLQPEAMTVRIGENALVEVSASISKQALAESGMDTGPLRTAALFLPDPCRLYGAWQLSVREGALCLSATRAEIAGITLPEQVVAAVTDSLAATVNQKLGDWGIAVSEIASENSCLIFRP